MFVGALHFKTDKLTLSSQSIIEILILKYRCIYSYSSTINTLTGNNHSHKVKYIKKLTPNTKYSTVICNR